jgi:hypothetical protein
VGVAYPGTLSQAVETQLVCDFCGVHGILGKLVRLLFGILDDVTYWQILFVGKDQEKSIPQLILVQHSLQLFSGLNNTITIVAVNNEDDTLGVLEVMSPEGADLVLSTDIPHCELNVLVLDSLNVEA